jgi:hypothetical protein
MFIPLISIVLGIFVVGFVAGFIVSACIGAGIVKAENPASDSRQRLREDYTEREIRDPERKGEPDEDSV